MENVKFDEKFKTNIPIVDYEHAKLFTIINDIIDASKEEIPNNLLYEINIGELVKYTKFHFRSEEELMERAGYEDFASHKAAHDAFTARVLEFQNELNENKLDVEKLVIFLTDWLTNHILIVDKKYEDSFKAAGIDKQIV